MKTLLILGLSILLIGIAVALLVYAKSIISNHHSHKH